MCSNDHFSVLSVLLACFCVSLNLLPGNNDYKFQAKYHHPRPKVLSVFYLLFYMLDKSNNDTDIRFWDIPESDHHLFFVGFICNNLISQDRKIIKILSTIISLKHK